MYDESQTSNENLGKTNQALISSRILAANRRNTANNANVVRNAAKVASKSNNVYAKAIGGAVNAADKLSGGRASQALGKHLNLANKFTPGGRLAQAALNKMSESGAADKIGSTSNQGGQNPSQKNQGANNSSNGLGSNQNNDDNNSEESGILSYKGTVKLLITSLIVMTPILVVIIFCNLFISASQIFINSIDLGTADSLSDSKANEKIEKSEDKWDNEINDKHENLSYNFNTDVYILNNSSKYIQVAKKYNEADLEELNDFYGNSIYESINTIENIDMKVVYNFYFKLYYIYQHYNADPYNVELDLPLLMATLSVYNKDKAVIFGSNTIGYDEIQIGMKTENDRFDYNKVHNYVSTPTRGEYDIEVLAQHMVSKQAIESCIDSNGKEVRTNIIKDDQIGTQVIVCNENETYQVSEARFDIDEEKYKEFLPEFLENKYFINNSSEDEGNETEDSNNDISTCSLVVQVDKYYKIVNPQTEKCYVHGFYDDNSWGLEPKFYNNILNLINDAKSHGCNAAIISGHRTYQKQAYFYNCYITKKCNSGNLAAKPGYSNHEYGIAADLRYLPDNPTCLNYYHTNAYKYGLDFPLLNASYPEDWHIEPIDIIKGTP